MSAILHFKPDVAGIDIDHVHLMCSQALEDFFSGCPILTNQFLRIFCDLEFVEKSTQLVSADYAIFGKVQFHSTNQCSFHGGSDFPSRSFFCCNDGLACERRWSQTPVERTSDSRGGERRWACRDRESCSTVIVTFNGKGGGVVSETVDPCFGAAASSEETKDCAHIVRRLR